MSAQCAPSPFLMGLTGFYSKLARCAPTLPRFSVALRPSVVINPIKKDILSDLCALSGFYSKPARCAATPKQTSFSVSSVLSVVFPFFMFFTLLAVSPHD